MNVGQRLRGKKKGVATGRKKKDMEQDLTEDENNAWWKCTRLPTNSHCLVINSMITYLQIQGGG